MNENIPQLATIRIQCNGNTGTAVLFFPSYEVDYVYVFSAKHCLTGKNFEKEFKKEDIVLDKIFNVKDGTYHTYTLTETDIVIPSGNVEDMALFILPKYRIVELMGREFFCQVSDTDLSIHNYWIRGFANFNGQVADRSFPLKFLEDQKDNSNIFTLKSDQQLDTYYQQALENVQGLSGCGTFTELNDNIYLTGIIHSYEDLNLFTATKVIAFNQLIPSDKFMLINPVRPETNSAILKSYVEMDKNREAINSRTRDTVGKVNIPRDIKLLNQLLKNSSLVLVHGKPGVGKSALAKAVVASLKTDGDTTIITFTAEQLYCQTLNEALQKAGYIANFDQIIGSPLSGKKILVWIESFEKLIESGYEGAFNELLALMKEHRQLAIVLTIRDYLLQKFKITYHYELPEGVVYYPVNEFNSEEIKQVREAIPEIEPLLDNPKIHHLLRTPYYLDKAARIIPQLLKEDQLDEAQFIKLMWEHIVEDGDKRRGTVFSAICLKRAREMSLYTATEESQETVDGLVRDNILQVDQRELANYYSPSHDILEDWALIRFIKQQKRDATDAKSFLATLENSPAIKRAFRLWLDEFYRQEPEPSASFVYALLLDPELAQTWKDELIVTSLRSQQAEVLFSALKLQLLANDCALLSQVMGLLQTSCKTIDSQSRDFDHLLPVGSGWDFIIDFIKDNLAAIQGFRIIEFQYLSVIESWSKQLPDFAPKSLPKGAGSAAFLLKDYIQRNQDKISSYRHGRLDSSFLKPYTAILFKLTASEPGMIEELLNSAIEPEASNGNWTNSNTMKSVRDYMINGVMSDQLCKFFPNKVIHVALEEWLQKEKITRPGSISGMIRERPDPDDFGLDEHLNDQSDFPSGYQTFFYWMFLYHPDKALDFLIPFLNTAFQKNHQALLSLKKEVEQITIQYEDGTDKTYFGNYEYWVMYRGINSRSRLITSLLMALEAGLLDLSDKGEIEYPVVKQYLARLIKVSNNVAVLGIVTSVIQAHPQLLDKTSVSLLGVPSFYHWDGTRSSSEMINMRVYNYDPFEKTERLKSNRRPHRQRFYLGLVGFVADYMFNQRTENQLLFKQVDAMWSNAPKDDKLWKKFLFDMDARKYEFKPITHPGYENIVQLVPGYDADVKKNVMSRDATDFVPPVNSLWARKAFESEKMPDNNYETWEIGYKYLKDSKQKNHLMASPGTMATVGLRDFADKLTDEEMVWCQQELIRHGERHLQKRDIFDISFNVMDENPPMMGLSYIFKTKPSSVIEYKAKELIFRLLLSRFNEQPKLYLEAGVANHLSKFQPEFVINCWYGLLTYISYNIANNGSYLTGAHLYFEDDIEALDSNRQAMEVENWKDQLVRSVADGTIEHPASVHASLDMATRWIMDDALRIIPYSTFLPAHHDFIQQIIKLHVSFLRDPKQSHFDFYESRHAFTYFYPRYLLNQPQQDAKKLFSDLLDLTLPTEGTANGEELSKFLYNLVKEFIRGVNDSAPIENFWSLWECLREWMIERMNAFLMPLFLMDLDWTEDSEGWNVLDGKNLYYKSFIVEWGFNRINASIKFLSGIAFNKFMPDSVSWVATMLKTQNANDADTKIAGKLVEKAFYKYGNMIKDDKTLLSDFLFILDFLIDKGSSKAYMLKEELIQYK